MGACTLAHLHTKGSGLLVHLHLPEDDSARGGPCVDDVRRLAAAFLPPLDRLPVDRHHSAARVGGRDPRHVPQAGRPCGAVFRVCKCASVQASGTSSQHQCRDQLALVLMTDRCPFTHLHICTLSATVERVLPVVTPARVRDGRHAIHYCIHSRLLLRCWEKEGNTPLTYCIL